MSTRIRGRDRRIQVRTEPEEDDEPEVEQPDPADGHVQPEGEQDEDERVNADLRQVVGVGEEREDRERQGQRHELERGGSPPVQVLDAPGERPRAALLGARDPLVDADPRRLLRLVGRRAQTFFTSGLPKMPCGRRSMNATRMRNTIRSLNALPSRPNVKSSM